MQAPLVAVAMLGCVSEVPEPSGIAAEAIYAGTPDDDARANDAVVALKVGDGTSTFVLCTGALVAPNVVLTARHCVSEATVDHIDCDENGASGNGAQVGADVTPASIHVFLGASPSLRTGTPAANGRAIVHPASTDLCNTDIAFVLLDAAIDGVRPLAMRLHAPVAAGETVRAVGYGENDGALPIGTRHRKDDVAILATGAGISKNRTPLASREFEVGLSICQGDSGGPAISEATGAIVGVVSRGGSCSLGYGHVYSATSGFAALVSDAFSRAGATVIEEPAPQEDAGATAAAIENGSSPRRAPSAPASDPACAARIAGSGDPGRESFATVAALVVALAIVRRRRRPNGDVQRSLGARAR